MDSSRLLAVIWYADHIICPSSLIAEKLQRYREQWGDKILFNPKLTIEGIKDNATLALLREAIHQLIAKVSSCNPLSDQNVGVKSYQNYENKFATDAIKYLLIGIYRYSLELIYQLRCIPEVNELRFLPATGSEIFTEI
ncbi:MAG: hypothetical protein HNEKOMLI_00257 [Sodalis sp. Psp]|nr:hypothetical protein [Sodalis sp. Psp]MCR3756754.1 hypothetical protein [Sodalis sp. Ppy]